MRYKEMIKNARERGIATEKAMWAGIDNLDELLTAIKDEHPDLYWGYLRDTHESLYGPHYNPEFAEYDLSRLSYTDSNGNVVNGHHWGFDEVRQAMAGREFGDGVTDCDIWVAANVMYSDFCKRFTEAQIIEAAYLFFFADEDWPDNGKIWEYMSL